MKRLLSVITLAVFMAIVMALTAFAADDTLYKITALSTPTIDVAGRTLQKGDTFSERSKINWADDRQSMEVKNLTTGRLHRFSAKAFRSKWNAASIADFIVATTKSSTRGEKGMALTARALNADKYPERRLALVVGNSDYEHMGYLRNAQKDASDVAATLALLGFDVIETYEADYDEMRSALALFSEKAGGYDVALFYYSGHGLQDEGVNYFIPIDAEMEMRSELKRCLNADDVLYAMEHSGARQRILLLDACRSHKRSWSRDASEGLARMEGEAGSVIMFSTMSGRVAFDGEGENSPFASALMSNIVKPEKSFAETMAAITRDTNALSGERQTPLQVGTLLSDFAFNSTGAAIDAAPATTPATFPGAMPTGVHREPTVTPVVVQPAMTSDIPDMIVYVESLRQAGTNAQLTMWFINQSGKTLEPTFADGSGLYDCNGTLVKLSTVLNGSNQLYNGVLLPPSVPVKLTLVFKDADLTCGMVPRIDLNFRNMDTPAPYGQAKLQIKKLEVDFKAPFKPAAPGKTTVTMTAGNVDARISGVQRVGDNVSFDLILTNDSGTDVEGTGVCGKEPCAGYEGYQTSFFTPDGVLYDNNNIIFRKANGERIYNNFTLPDGIPVRLKVTLQNVPAKHAYLPQVSIAFRGMDPANSYGQALIKILNLPL